MGRAPCCDKVGLKKGAWSKQEDQILIDYILHHGPSNWRSLPKKAGLLRCGKSCRLRWTNYLRPDIKRGNFTKDEEETIITLQREMGNRWSAIASRFPGRTDNEIKNMWHTIWKKKVAHHNNDPPDSVQITNQDLSEKQASAEAYDNPTSSDTRNVQDDIETIDDNFWSEVLSAADSDEFGLETNVQFSGPNTPLLGTAIDTDTGDDMEFWCDLLMAAAGDSDPSNTILRPLSVWKDTVSSSTFENLQKSP